jgi:hypothetical protein
MDRLEAFRERLRKLMESNRQPRQTFNPADLLNRLLNLNQVTRLAPGVEGRVQQYVVQNPNEPISKSYLQTLAKSGGLPGHIKVNTMAQQGAVSELEKMGSTQSLPGEYPKIFRQPAPLEQTKKFIREVSKAPEPAKKKKQWWEWQ